MGFSSSDVEEKREERRKKQDGATLNRHSLGENDDLCNSDFALNGGNRLISHVS